MLSAADHSIVIVGGGVAGLAMANALAARKIPSLVLEKTHAPGVVDRGDVLHRASIRLFKKWKIENFLIQARPLRISRFKMLNNDGRLLLSIDLAVDLTPPAELIVLRHSNIQSMLEAAARSKMYTEIRRGVCCRDLIQKNGRILGVSTDKGDFFAPLTVLAAGANSRIRDKFFAASSRQEYSVSFVNLRCKGASGLDTAGYYVLGPKGIMIMVPLPNNEMRIGLQVPQYGTIAGSCEKSIIEMVSERLSTFPVSRLRIISQTTYRLSKSMCASFWINGAAVIGDAAHTTHPAGGQGMNMAFQDADCLAEHLCPTKRDLNSVDQACAAYSNIRCREVKRILVKTHMLGMLGAIRNRTWIRMRESALRIANSTNLFKRWIFKRVVDVS